MADVSAPAALSQLLPGQETTGLGDSARPGCARPPSASLATLPSPVRAAVAPPSPAELARVRALVRRYDDYPTPGIVFRDFFPVFRAPQETQIAVRAIAAWVESTYSAHCARLSNASSTPSSSSSSPPLVIAGLDARGFVMGPLVAAALGASFVPVRKRGKLPGACVEAAFTKEYGSDALCVQADSVAPNSAVFLLDDVLATGGTLCAAVQVFRAIDVNPVAAVVLVAIDELQGATKVAERTGVPVHSLFAFVDADP